MNLAPSRARRQLAARLALHSKQNTENNANGEAAEVTNLRDLNPFATEEDDEEQEEFTIGDLEIEAEGKGILPPGTALTGQDAPLDELNRSVKLEDNNSPVDIVGTPMLDASVNNTCTSFPSMYIYLARTTAQVMNEFNSS